MLRSRSCFNSIRSATNLRRSLSIVSSGTATTALSASCYKKIDFKIGEDLPVFDAVQRMAAHNVGCLAVTEVDGSSGRVVRSIFP